MPNGSQMISVEEARRKILESVPILGTEKVDILSALDRVLAEDVQAGRNIPPRDNSSMDGFALRAEDVRSASRENPVVLDITEDIPAGTTPRLKVGLTGWIEGFNIGKVGTFLLGAIGPFASFMSDLLLVFVFMIFILAGRGRLIRKFGQAFPPAQAETLTRTACRVDREVQRYLAVKTLDNLVIGVLAAAVLAVLGVRFAVLFGVLAVLFNYIPALGPAASVAAPTLLTVFLEGGLTIKVLAVLVLLAGIHVAVSRLLERRLMTKEISLSPLLVLFSLFFGGWLWGLTGMIVAVPSLTAARIVFENVPALRPLGAMMDR